MSMISVPCDSATDPSSGSVNVTTNGTVSQATYECSPGYYVDGATSSFCLEDGSWDATAPNCCKL